MFLKKYLLEIFKEDKLNIEFKKLSFRYQSRFIVKKVDNQFDSGHIHFIKGGNGAGKTTFLKLIATILKPTYGSILYNELNSKKFRKAGNRITYISYLASLYPELTLNENIELFSKISGFKIDIKKGNEIGRAVQNNNLLNEFNLTAFKNIQTKKFSTGMLKKSSLIISLMHESDIYLFDEPFSGLDIESVNILKNYIIKLSKMDKMVFLVSHLIQEIDNAKYYVIENEKLRTIS